MPIMTIELTPENELLIARALRSGAYRDATEVVSAALQAFASGTESGEVQSRRSKLWDLRQGVKLGDVSVSELIAEGRE
jgi:Arc/MetJ-type ribon-helix-helix transcriptional regulator